MTCVHVTVEQLSTQGNSGLRSGAHSTQEGRGQGYDKRVSCGDVERKRESCCQTRQEHMGEETRTSAGSGRAGGIPAGGADHLNFIQLRE